MDDTIRNKIYTFVVETLKNQFYDKRVKKLEGMTLTTLILRKCPYLLAAKTINNVNNLIKEAVDASLSSGDETIFGDFIEQVAVYVCEMTMGGHKSLVDGLDLEFEDASHYYIVSIKSGPNWGNASSVKKMHGYFAAAQRTLHTSNGSIRGKQVVCVEGCCYGNDENPFKPKSHHWKYCGQRFWELISGGDSALYKDLMVPMLSQTQINDTNYTELYTTKLSTLIQEFQGAYVTAEGAIDWEKYIENNSGNQPPKPLKIVKPRRKKSKA